VIDELDDPSHVKVNGAPWPDAGCPRLTELPSLNLTWVIPLEYTQAIAGKIVEDRDAVGRVVSES